MDKNSYTLEYLPNSVILKFHMNELDLMSSPRIVSGIESTVKNIRDTRFIIDIDKLDYIDSTGLSLIFSIIKECRKRGVTISIVCNNQNIKNLFRLFNMDFSFTFYSDIEEVYSQSLE
jgi:anti-sigma B factor antagonist